MVRGSTGAAVSARTGEEASERGLVLVKSTFLRRHLTHFDLKIPSMYSLLMFVSNTLNRPSDSRAAGNGGKSRWRSREDAADTGAFLSEEPFELIKLFLDDVRLVLLLEPAEGVSTTKPASQRLMSMSLEN